MGKPWERDLMSADPRMDRFVWHQRVTTTATLMAKSATSPQTRVLGRILLRNPVSPREDGPREDGGGGLKELWACAYPWSRVLCQRPLSADWATGGIPVQDVLDTQIALMAQTLIVGHARHVMSGF